jgi:radical SAM/Cys-rich protein
MQWQTMKMILEALSRMHCKLVDLTGGSPELNPYFRQFVEALCNQGQSIQVRTNLTVLLESGMEAIMEFLKQHKVQLVASMPCYLEENVCAQRGPKVYALSIEAIKRLNALGYGYDPDLPLNLVYNPGGPFLPPEQSVLEDEYRFELSRRFGINFTHLLTITNMPIGRFRTELRRQNREHAYLMLLKEAFNPETLSGLMCRHQISVGWDGVLYDCDFNMALGLPVDHGAPDHIRSFNPEVLQNRRIVTGEHCFGCTAGWGSSCGGTLL